MQWWPLWLLGVVSFAVISVTILRCIFPPERLKSVPPFKNPNIDRALSLYTFYEGRVQSVKSILVGILAGILSLQIPILVDIVKANEATSSPMTEVFPLIILCLPALIVFSSLKLHMGTNNKKSNIFKKCLDDASSYKDKFTYNPDLSQWICKVPKDLQCLYKYHARMRLRSEWVLISIIFPIIPIIGLWIWYASAQQTLNQVAELEDKIKQLETTKVVQEEKIALLRQESDQAQQALASAQQTLSQVAELEDKIKQLETTKAVQEEKIALLQQSQQSAVTMSEKSIAATVQQVQGTTVELQAPEGMFQDLQAGDRVEVSIQKLKP